MASGKGPTRARLSCFRRGRVHRWGEIFRLWDGRGGHDFAAPPTPLLHAWCAARVWATTESQQLKIKHQILLRIRVLSRVPSRVWRRVNTRLWVNFLPTGAFRWADSLGEDHALLMGKHTAGMVAVQLHTRPATAPAGPAADTGEGGFDNDVSAVDTTVFAEESFGVDDLDGWLG